MSGRARDGDSGSPEPLQHTLNRPLHLQAAEMRSSERTAALELAHKLAIDTALRVLTGWQQLRRAQQHRRQRLLQGCLAFWSFWAPGHRVRNAGWREAAGQLQQKKLERCFLSWRWYCQVRPLAGLLAAAIAAWQLES